MRSRGYHVRTDVEWEAKVQVGRKLREMGKGIKVLLRSHKSPRGRGPFGSISTLPRSWYDCNRLR